MVKQAAAESEEEKGANSVKKERGEAEAVRATAAVREAEAGDAERRVGGGRGGGEAGSRS